jgi:hypothetical protein
VASSISARWRRTGGWLARPKTSGMVRTGRSGTFSPPPRIWHGLRGIRRSSVAVLKTAPAAGDLSRSRLRYANHLFTPSPKTATSVLAHATGWNEPTGLMTGLVIWG